MAIRYLLASEDGYWGDSGNFDIDPMDGDSVDLSAGVVPIYTFLPKPPLHLVDFYDPNGIFQAPVTNQLLSISGNMTVGYNADLSAYTALNGLVLDGTLVSVSGPQYSYLYFSNCVFLNEATFLCLDNQYLADGGGNVGNFQQGGGYSYGSNASSGLADQFFPGRLSKRIQYWRG